jgi:hypothetical protein
VDAVVAEGIVRLVTAASRLEVARVGSALDRVDAARVVDARLPARERRSASVVRAAVRDAALPASATGAARGEGIAPRASTAGEEQQHAQEGEARGSHGGKPARNRVTMP